MKLEKQVVSLELAKKLKELGVNKESYFAWRYTKGRGNDSIIPSHAVPEVNDFWEHYNAFTVAELGEMLPKTLTIRGYDCELVWKHDCIGYGTYQFECLHEEIWIEPTDTEADARAKMLIYLIENRLITVESLAA